MKPNDKIYLRLSNNNNATGVVLNDDKDIFTINLPNNLKNRGKCYVRVMSCIAQVEDVASGNRIVPAYTRIFALRSNISMLGYDTENRASSNAILGTGIIPTTATEVIELSSPDASLGFTCPSLPNEIVIEKLCYNAADQALDRANSYTTTSLPCEVCLELQFFDEFEC